MLSEFWNEHKNPDGKKRRCIPCTKNDRKAYYDKNRAAMVERTQNWKKLNPDKYLAGAKNVRINLKRKLVEGYGGKCTCCGESILEFLTLEHLNNDGPAHRKAMKNSSQCTYRDVIKRGFPRDYTILCMNCNTARRFGNTCPHQIDRATNGGGNG